LYGSNKIFKTMPYILDPKNPVPTVDVARPRNLKALTSIRFFAAMHVALYHLVRPSSLWGPLKNVMGTGYIGVSFFFGLSGFILTYSHAAEYERGRGSPKKFWVARLARIYPVYLVTLIFAGYAGFALLHKQVNRIAFLANLLLVQSWSSHMVNLFHVTAWSLSVEVFFYLLFPFLLLRLRPSTAARAYFGIFVFWLLALAVPVLCVYLYPQAAWPSEIPNIPGSLLRFRIERLPILALPEFLAGVLLGWLFLRFRPSPTIASWLAPTGILSLIAVLALSNHLPGVLMHNGLFIPLYSMIILGLSEENWLSHLLSAPLLVLLGEASFALYLIHFLFNDWITGRFGASQGLGAALWKLAIVIPLSVALHLLVERPARALILKRRSQKQAVQHLVSVS
jgi:peptidoglycan/LPS O-acetylase OafA/YrhL